MADLRAMVTENQQSKAEFAQQKQVEREALFQRRDGSVVEMTSDPNAYRAYLDLQAANPAVSPGNLALVRTENPAELLRGMTGLRSNPRGAHGGPAGGTGSHPREPDIFRRKYPALWAGCST